MIKYHITTQYATSRHIDAVTSGRMARMGVHAALSKVNFPIENSYYNF